MDNAALLLFIPTFFMVSATQELCITLSMTLSMTIGVHKSLPMMAAELIGVALVSLLAIIGVAAILLTHPVLFTVLKYVGGAYLFYLGIEIWLSRGKMTIADSSDPLQRVPPLNLAIQAFVIAIANPRW